MRARRGIFLVSKITFAGALPHIRGGYINSRHSHPPKRLARRLQQRVTRTGECQDGVQPRDLLRGLRFVQLGHLVGADGQQQLSAWGAGPWRCEGADGMQPAGAAQLQGC